jgi:hypothetical protein
MTVNLSFNPFRFSVFLQHCHSVVHAKILAVEHKLA